MFLAGCGAFGAAAAARASQLSDALSGIELRYNRLAGLRADFEQILSYAGRVRVHERGELALLRPQRMRWDYSTPKGKLLVSDGELLKMYSPLTNQVRIVRLTDSADMRAPLSFLLGRLNFSRQFRNLRLETIDGGTTVVGEGRSGKEAFTTVEFHYEPDFRLNRLKVVGRDESVTEFRFANEQINPSLQASLFEFNPPAEAELLPETTLESEF
jgi:outer membrane lipoprotein carrier protein